MLIGNHNLVVVGINSADTGRSFDTPYAEAKAFDTVFVRYDDAVEDWRRILQLADGLRTGDSEEEDWRRMTVEVEDMRRIGSRLTTDGRRTGETSSEATATTAVGSTNHTRTPPPWKRGVCRIAPGRKSMIMSAG